MGHPGTRRAWRRAGPARAGRTLLGRILVPVALAVSVMVPFAAAAPTGAAASPRIPVSGYRLISGDGGIFTFDEPFAGSAAGDPTLCPANTADRQMPDGTCWSMATAPAGAGYWILNAYTGAVHAYGTAVSYGDRTASNAGSPDLWPTSVGITSTPSGHGYWILDVGLSGMGTVQAFGDAAFYGDQSTLVPQVAPAGSPVGIVATMDGLGYWIVDSDGGVFAFGDARFAGSMGGTPLNAPVVGMARTPDGQGYWLAAADGGVFAFGDAPFAGSEAGSPLAAPVVGITGRPFGPGYYLAGADGGVFALGGAPFLGSMGGQPLNRPVFGISAPPGGVV